MTAHEQWVRKTDRFRDGGARFAEAELVELGDKVIAEMDAEITRLQAEITRLRAEGVPGVMHEVDRAFYDLAITERNYYRVQVENRDATIAQLQRRLEHHDA